MFIADKDELAAADFQAGVTVLVDKPLHWTSFDVVNKIRFALKKKLKVRKIKVGHAGTLDPLATGLLIIAIGKDTKTLEDYQAMYKVYTGSMRLGATTKSYDYEFEPDNFFPVSHIDEELLERARQDFIGIIEQVPPKYSAIKIKGEAAYKLARRGEDFQMKKRKVEIFRFDFDKIALPDIEFTVKCQKGTYIRSLVHDFGAALDSGAYMTALQRIAIGQYKLENAFALDEIITAISD